MIYTFTKNEDGYIKLPTAWSNFGELVNGAIEVDTNDLPSTGVQNAGIMEIQQNEDIKFTLKKNKTTDKWMSVNQFFDQWAIKSQEKTMYIITPDPQDGDLSETLAKNTFYAYKEQQIPEQVTRLLQRGFKTVNVYKLESIYKLPKTAKPLKYNVTNGEIVPE